MPVDEWKSFLPDYTRYPDRFKATLPYLLASMVYHRKWITDTLPVQHPLFLQQVWTSGILERLAEKVIIGHFHDVNVGMKATGIPPYVVLSHQISSLEDMMESTMSDVS